MRARRRRRGSRTGSPLPGRPRPSGWGGRGVAAFTPWLVVLIALALVPALLNEWHFTKAGYRLAWLRSPERRRLDYFRYLGASVETAKEVKLFGLSGYVTTLYATVARRL